MIKIGTSVVIKDNLAEELTRLTFDQSCVETMKALVGKKYKVYDVWTDADSGQTYATVDLCVEIPTQRLEEVEVGK